MVKFIHVYKELVEVSHSVEAATIDEARAIWEEHGDVQDRAEVVGPEYDTVETLDEWWKDCDNNVLDNPTDRTGSKCDVCGAVCLEIIGCPDGLEICQSCFDDGEG